MKAKPTIIEELDVVALTHAVKVLAETSAPEYPVYKTLRKGSTGTVVHVHKPGEAYEVEFVESRTGYTVYVGTFKEADLVLKEKFAK